MPRQPATKSITTAKASAVAASPVAKLRQRRAHKPRHGEERAERREREFRAAERRQIAEGGKRDPEQPGRDRHDEKSERGQRKEPQHGKAYWFTP